MLELFGYQRLSHQTLDLDITNFSTIARAGNMGGGGGGGGGPPIFVTAGFWRRVVWLTYHGGLQLDLFRSWPQPTLRYCPSPIEAAAHTRRFPLPRC
jgi:hypothetical protein